MAQWLRVPTALAEDLGLVPSTHMAAKNVFKLGVVAQGRQRQVDLCEFKGSLVYRVSSRTA